MPRLYLIRHAKPAATWSEATDPGLDVTGHTQAASAAEQMTQLTSPRNLYTSPLQRCRQTAAALEQLWQRSAQVFPEVAEIPSPPLAVGQRHVWLQQAMGGTWTQLRQQAQPGWPDYLSWRSQLLEHITALAQDSVIFSHFIAINVIVGAARKDDSIVCFRPDHASITVVETQHGELRIVELGQQAQTLVLARS
jgi:broad specificity phosphatase PhoE